MQTGVVSEKTSVMTLEAPTIMRRRPDGRPALRSRGDNLPENTRYRDDGCNISQSCFNCPLPRCRYEEPGGLRALLNESRDQEIVQLRLKGMAVEELAGRFGISRRTVFRVIGTRRIPARTQRPSGRDYDTTPIPIRNQQPALQAPALRTREEAHCA
ncbi:MAG: helix-turn-helix domain-containing protein [Chloroflexota bacterium]